MLLLSALLEARADDVKLALLDPRERQAPADRCDVELCTTLLGMIQGATTTIDFAFYGFRNQTQLLEAMRAARDRGVRIRGVVDMDVKNENYYDSTPLWTKEFPDVRTDWKTDLATQANQRSFKNVAYRCPRPAGFEGPLQCLEMELGQDRCYLSAHVSREAITYEGDIMHDKFVVVDGRYVWTGSTNASDSCSGGYNSNLVLAIDSPAVAGFFTAEFEQMYAGRFHRQKEAQALPMRAQISNDVAVEVFFSPQHRPLTKAVLPLIEQAREQIDVAVFFLTHKTIAQALIDAKNRGVRVRVIMDATGARNEYTKHEVLRLAGIPVKVEDFGGKMHAKSAVIDHRVVVGGSMNWTNAGDDDNDENTVLVYSAKHAEQYERWFETLWAGIPDKWLQGMPDPESRDSGRACFDETDNDFDDLDDAEDPGCGANPPPMAALPPYRIVPMNGAKCSWELVEPEPEH